MYCVKFYCYNLKLVNSLSVCYFNVRGEFEIKHTYDNEYFIQWYDTSFSY